MLSKKFNHNRIKPRPQKEPKYLSWLHSQNLVCFSCGKQNKIELHHIKMVSSDVKSDRKVIPLCGEECHRNGRILSAHGTPTLWRKTYSMDEQLAVANELYREYTDGK